MDEISGALFDSSGVSHPAGDFGSSFSGALDLGCPAIPGGKLLVSVADEGVVEGFRPILFGLGLPLPAPGS